MLIPCNVYPNNVNVLLPVLINMRVFCSVNNTTIDDAHNKHMHICEKYQKELYDYTIINNRK